MTKNKLLIVVTIFVLLCCCMFSDNMVKAFVPNLKSTAQTETTITLSWNPSDDFTFEGYCVTYSTSVNGPYTTIATITDKSVTSYAVTGLTPDYAYYFILVDKYSPNLGISHSTSSSNTLQANTKAKPTISITAQTTTTASLLWTDYNSYSTQMPFVSYTIQMSTTGLNGPWTTVTTITDSTQNSYMITGLGTGLYHVCMYDTVGTSDSPQTCATSNYAVISNVAVSISNTSPTTVYQGQQVQFTATPSGGSSHYNFQWYANGNKISGATSASLTYTPPSVSTYAITCKIEDATYTDSKATSNSIMVTAQPSPSPVNPTQPVNAATPSPSQTQPSNTPNGGTTDNGETRDPSKEDSNQGLIIALVIAITVIVILVIGAIVVIFRQKSARLGTSP